MPAELIVETDGGSRGNPGPAGYGAVVIDAATGETLAETAEYIGTATNNVAEYRGLIAGLRTARGLAPQATVRVRMDSKLVVEQMTGRWKVTHPDMRPLSVEAKNLYPAGQVSYEWIPRSRNKRADRLANEAMDAGRCRGYLSGGGSGGEQRQPKQPPAAAAVPAEAEVAAEVASEVASAGAPFEAPPSVVVGRPPDLGTPTTFVLLRHGETPLTPQKRFSGSGGDDPELSEVGWHQARQVAAVLAARGTIQEVVTSPLTRCRQTAGIVADRLRLDLRIDDGLRETGFGAWEGLTFTEVKERHPEDLKAWLASPKAAPTGGGESFAAAARRIALCRDKLLTRYAGKTLLLVTHVTPVKTLVRLALGAPPASLFRMELSAASLSAVAYYADGNTSVRLFNDTSHLCS
ncbi:MAG: bifunctional RNase H/acid phosphatase [Streptomycetaceae bacterium]|nr:bifunctional RNase H/acid phosphatase [Streptomycetaceae bacterium]